jgi:hypothetical protein
MDRAHSTGDDTQLLVKFGPYIIITIAAVVALASLVGVVRAKSQNGPPYLPGMIPFVSNTYQYLMDMKSFMPRAA